MKRLRGLVLGVFPQVELMNALLLKRLRLHSPAVPSETHSTGPTDAAAGTGTRDDTPVTV